MANRNDAKTPAMAQYHRFKREHPDEILFFQMGDFFEMFYDDAQLVARELGLTLTSRSKGEDAVPMAGVPVRNVDSYLRRLVRKGYRVAICDQVEDPRQAKGVVRREVTRIVSAGTLVEEDLLERSRPNYLAALVEQDGRVGVAFADVSTGAFSVLECAPDELADALAEKSPAECLVPESEEGEREGRLGRAVREAVADAAIHARPAWEFARDAASETLREHYGVRSLQGFGLDEGGPCVRAAGAALRYLLDTQRADLQHLDPPTPERRGARLVLDRATRRCLELVEASREGGREGTLLSVLDETRTAPGARRLRALLLQPLRDGERVRERQAAVDWLVSEPGRRAEVREALRAVADVERLLTRVVTGRANARDLVGLRRSLEALPALVATLQGTQSVALAREAGSIDPLPELTAELGRALVDEPPATLHDGGIFRDGYDPRLDELRALQRDGKGTLLEYQREEAERTGIPNLKIGFHRVFGYYLEVTNAHRDRVPPDYHRKQTLKNAERYVTPRLAEFERRVLGAEEKAKALEAELFETLRARVAEHTPSLKRTAAAVAEIDVHQALAEVAGSRGWVRPEVLDEGRVEVEAGRHPVLDAALQGSFVPNDCRLDRDTRRFAVVTGPNMSGKSTYIRQVALFQILAQIGAFVPAARAVLPLCDRVFARVGASDDLTRGHSTFMVEMTEAANILNNATERSLVVLDEIGRGTSTFDGLALAWAISEHLARRVRCLGLFATHYHQLTDLAEREPGVFNLNVQVREWGDEIVFLHRIVEGGSDRSYGIHVARLAGVPRPVLDRAREILQDLEADPLRLAPERAGPRQLGLFEQAPAPPPAPAAPSPAEREVLQALRATDPDRLTPLDALERLAVWRRRLEGGDAPPDASPPPR